MSLGPLMIDLEGIEPTARELERLRSPLVGGVILFSRNFSDRVQLEELVAGIHEIRSPSLLVAVDQEGGRVQRFREPFRRLPPARSIGRFWDDDPGLAVDLATDIAWLMAAELRACGIDLSFAPVVDIDLGLAEVIGDRAFHSDVDAVSKLAAASVKGMGDAGMAATAKHFPTHAGARSDSHTEAAVDRRDFDELFDDLEPYRYLIDHGLHSIMISHVSFPALDPLPASFSSWWLERQLRGELGFGGAIISDDLGMAGASIAGTVPERAAFALEAGCDLVLVCNVPDQIDAVLERLDGYIDPAAQLRLMRLRARPADDWRTLRASPRWAKACGLLERIEAKPQLRLEG